MINILVLLDRALSLLSISNRWVSLPNVCGLCALMPTARNYINTLAHTRFLGKDQHFRNKLTTSYLQHGRRCCRGRNRQAGTRYCRGTERHYEPLRPCSDKTGRLSTVFSRCLHADHVTIQADDDLAKELGIPLLLADYANVKSLTNLLESNLIDTVICTIDDATGSAQLNLIEAAENSSSTKRFIPSEFGLRYTQE